MRLPGDRGHLDRLSGRWVRASDDRVTAGRLRRLIGVMVIVQMLDGLPDERGRSGSGSKVAPHSNSGSASVPGHRGISTAPTEERSQKRSS
jgi:hypothetical protein